MDDRYVKTYDDVSVKIRRIDSFMELPAVQSSSHLLFYFLQEEPSSQNVTQDIVTLPRAERRKIAKYWFGLLEPGPTQINAMDLRTLCHKKQLNGAIISHFFFVVAKNCSDRKALAASTTFYENLREDRLSCSEVSSLLAKADFKALDAVIIPINVNENHWIVASIYPKARCIVVVDSLRDHGQRRSVFSRLMSFLRLYWNNHDEEFYMQDWVLINPRTLPLQTDNHSCGVFTCVNAYNCTLPNSILSPKPKNMIHFRYWIAHIACNTERRPLHKRKELKHDLNRSLINERNREIIIRNTVPGHGKMVGFFESLKQYVDSRMEISGQSESSHNKHTSDGPTSHTEAGIDANSSTRSKLTKEIDRTSESSILQNAQEVSTGRDEDQNEVIVDDDAFCLHMSHSSSDDSIYSGQKQVREKLQYLSQLKERFLARLVLDIEHGNERYIVLALYGKNKLLSVFKKELNVISSYISESDLEILKGALYKMFCNEVPDHQYYGVSLPTIHCNRYGLTSVQFIDYVILPDALCLDYSNKKGVSYEVAVIKTCGADHSRLTVYWSLVLSKVSIAS